MSTSRGELVFARINKGLSPDACAAGSNSSRWRKRYASNPAAFAAHLQQVLPLLDFVSIEVERAGLPSEFVFIPLVESWYQPDAVGQGGPAGMWQMISSTARNHGIHIQSGYDGRLSAVESTRAALSYLKTLQGMFGNWESVVMAYNAGEGRMHAAFRQARSREASAGKRRPHGLSNVTYDSVGKLQALACLVSEPRSHGLSLPLSAQFVPLAPVLMDANIDTIEQFARRRGLASAQLRKLNPGYKGGRVANGVPRLVLAPYGRQAEPDGVPLATTTRAQPALALAEALATSDGAAETHEVHPGESLWSIARLHRLSMKQLRQINRLGATAVVRPGQLLRLVP
jgi:membrane-bound lytic murein transglycosylase D